MQTITLKARADKDGLICLETPTDIMNQEIEIVLVMHPVEKEPLDEGYFEETYRYVC